MPRTTSGDSHDLVLLHGWGTHGGVWGNIGNTLGGAYRIRAVDLPGHGESTAPPDGCTLTSMADMIGATVKNASTLIGWSLGGMIALEIARRYPKRVARIVLIASTPQFVADSEWPHALATETLEGFGVALETDYEDTMRRFFALQVKGGDGERAMLRVLLQRLDARPRPDPRILRAGLEILRKARLQGHLRTLTCPLGVIHGTRDMLVPIEAAHAIKALYPQTKLRVLRGAAHVPFISHPESFASALEECLNDEVHD